MPRHRRVNLESLKEKEKKDDEGYLEENKMRYIPPVRTGSGVRFGYYAKKRRANSK